MLARSDGAASVVEEEVLRRPVVDDDLRRVPAGELFIEVVEDAVGIKPHLEVEGFDRGRPVKPCSKSTATIDHYNGQFRERFSRV